MYIKGDPYSDYYLTQAGSGIGQVYSGTNFQKGHGIGSFLSSIFRSIVPLFKSGARAVGKEMLRTGGNIMHDIAMDTSPRESMKRRFGEAGDNIKNKLNNKLDVLVGQGYKKRKITRKAQSKVARSSRRITKKGRAKTKKSKTKKKKTNKARKTLSKKRDIFA